VKKKRGVVRQRKGGIVCVTDPFKIGRCEERETLNKRKKGKFGHYKQEGKLKRSQKEKKD